MSGPIEIIRDKPIATTMRVWYADVVKAVIRKPTSSNGLRSEARQLHATAKRIVANKKSSLRLLAATGMYTLKGKLKPQFR